MKLTRQLNNTSNELAINNSPSTQITKQDALNIIKYVPNIAMDTGMCLLLKPYKSSVVGLITLTLIYLAQGCASLKRREHKKFLDLTIRHGITVSIFYLIPFALIHFIL